jgi:hypothetical protein
MVDVTPNTENPEWAFWLRDGGSLKDVKDSDSKKLLDLFGVKAMSYCLSFPEVLFVLLKDKLIL